MRKDKAEGVADGKHPFAHLEVLAVAHGDDMKIGSVDLDEGKVGGGVAADYGSREVTVVVECDLEALGISDHMVVGHDIAVLADDHARAQTALLLTGLLLLLRLAALGLAEEIFKERIAGIRAVALAAHLRRGETLDRHHTVDGLLGGTYKIILGDRAARAEGGAYEWFICLAIVLCRTRGKSKGRKGGGNKNLVHNKVLEIVEMCVAKIMPNIGSSKSFILN